MPRRYNPFFELLRMVLGIWFRWRFNIHAVHKDVLNSLTPPFLVIPNHQNTFDPFILAYYIKTPVYWVASDANFRSPFVRFWLKLVGTIPKAKAMTDIETVRTMVSAVKGGGVVGVFAEGERTWDGKTLPLIASTAKLVRMLNVPVICPVMKGGYVSLPRWSPYIRKGEIEIDFSRVLYPADFAALKVREIHSRLTSLLEHDDYEWQGNRNMPFVSKHSAEYLECVLFVCLDCKSLNSLASRGKLVSCTECGTEWHHDEHSRLSKQTSSTPGLTPGDWYRQQCVIFKDRVSNALKEEGEEFFFSDESVRVTRGYKTEKGSVLGRGEVSLSTAGIHFSLLQPNRNKDRMNTRITQFIPVESIKSQNVIYRSQFEFYFNNTLYSFSFEGRPGCGIKWLHGVNYIQEELRGKADEN